MNSLSTDIVHLHWIAGEMLSIGDIGRIRKRLVWTLHDMWPFAGAEHYTEDVRWKDGYTSANRPAYEMGVDLNRWTWRRKVRCWQQPMHIVAPSRWLADCARQSALMRDWPVRVIPNPLDTDVWRMVSRDRAREALHLPPDAPLIAFGAIDGGRDSRKGFDLLKDAIARLRERIPRMELLVIGPSAPMRLESLRVPVRYMGHVADDARLRLLYSASDVVAISSRQDNLPNVGIEAHACGIPVVAFDVGGLSDIVIHEHTGYLARACDSEELAHGLHWVLADSNRRAVLGAAARQRAVESWSSTVVAGQYIDLYEEALFDREPAAG